MRNLDFHIAVLRHGSRSITSSPATRITQRRKATRGPRTAELIPPLLRSVQLSLKPQSLLALLPQFPLSSLSRKLRRRIRRLKLFDCLEETLSLVTRLVQVVLEILDRFITAVDLTLEVLDCAVHIADAAGFSRTSCFEVLKL